MIGIYRITSCTGAIYIGQSVNIEKRFKKYKCGECKSQTKLYLSLLKHGYDNHIFEILESCTIENLNIRERYYQDLYLSYSNKGLNCRATKTTDKSGFISEETKLKLSIINKVKSISPENRLKMILGLRAIKNIKRPRSKDFIYTDKIKAKHLSMNKPIKQLTLTGIFISNWINALVPAKELNLHATHIRACCRNIRKSSGGYKWEYQ